MPSVFVSGISTDVGKTFVSAILTQAFAATYYKPVQSGKPADRDWIQKILPTVQTLPETYFLREPMSPHAAAALEHTTIELSSFSLPEVFPLVVEGAGGLLVPLNPKHSNLDLIKKFGLPVVLVCNFYLGSINHTLLSLQVLQAHNIKIHSLIFNGEKVESTVQAVREHFLDTNPQTKTFFVPLVDKEKINTQTVIRLAERLRQEWNI